MPSVPVQGSNQSSGSKPKKGKPKHRSFFGSVVHGATSGVSKAAKGTAHVAAGTGRGVYRGVTGLPTATYMSGRAIGHDVGKFFAHPTGHYGRSHTARLAKQIGKAEVQQYRHFGKGGDVSGPLFDVAALLTAGGGAAGRLGEAGKAISKVSKVQRGKSNLHLDAAVTAKRMGHPMPKSHMNKLGITEKQVKAHDAQYGKILEERINTKSLVKRTPGGAKLNTAFAVRQGARAAGRELKTRPLPKTRRLKAGYYPVASSPVPPYRALRKGREALRTKGSAEKELAREQLTRERLAQNMGIPVNQRVARRLAAERRPNKVAETAASHIGAVMNLPMGALRMAMWARPRYYIQNIGQTAQMIGLKPGRTAKSIKLAKQTPDVAKLFRGALGEAQAGAIASGLGPSRAGRYLGGKMLKSKKPLVRRAGGNIQMRGLQGAAGHAANIPESFVRQIAAFNEMQRIGKKTPAHMREGVMNIRRLGTMAPEMTALRRAEEDVGAFGRLFHGERAFQKTQIPIFYPMFKALTRLGYRFPSEHPYATAGGMALGKKGKAEQHRLLGDLPFWGQYLVPKGAGNPKAKRGPKEAVFNPANIYQLQPAADISKQVSELGRQHGPRPGLSLLQETGPLPWILYAMMTGHDIQTGYPLRLMNRKLIHKNITKTAPEAALREYFQNLPLSDLAVMLGGGKPALKSFEPGSNLNRLLQQLGPGPAFTPRTLLTKETQKQAKREKQYGRGKSKRKKKSYFKG